MITGYLAPVGLEKQLRDELQNITKVVGRLIFAEGPPQKTLWAQNIWHNVQFLSFQSINDAAKKLRAMHGLWTHFPSSHIRRAQLIQEKLPYLSAKKIAFPSLLPKAPLGAWTLLDEDTLAAASRTDSPLPHGEFHFEERKEPPSRAYLKLWEVFTRMGRFPKPGDICLEVGASPGSWSWVLANLGAKVIAVDKAPLAAPIAELPNITFLKKDAFSLHPKDFPKVDWIFSDVICYPEKLLSWIQLWLQVGNCQNFICTLKFQGDANYEIVQEFEKIPGSAISHLFHNKHEITWALIINHYELSI